MTEALVYAASRVIDHEGDPRVWDDVGCKYFDGHYRMWPSDEAKIALFRDGSAVACASDWACYESGSSPRSPRFWIGDPIK